MFIAIGFRDNRISSIFEISTEIEIVELETSLKSIEKIPIKNGSMLIELIQKLKEKKVLFLVCNILSRDAEALFHIYGIRTIPFVTGDWESCIKFIEKHKNHFFENKNFRRQNRRRGFINQFNGE